MKIELNAEHNGIEIKFDGKPSAEILNELHNGKWRWHNVRRVWYNKDTADNRTTAERLTGNALTTDSGKPVAEAVKTEKGKKPIASLWERTRTDSLPAYGTENKIKKVIKATAEAKGWGYDRAAADYFRKELKNRFPEVKFSVTSGGAGYLDSVDITIISSPYKYNTVSGNPNVEDWRNRYDRKEESPELKAVSDFCKKLHNSADADDGDYYADYGAHHELYGSVSISYSYNTTEPTAEQIADVEDFEKQLEAQKEAEKKAFEEKCKKEVEEEKIRKAEQEKQAKMDAENKTAILNHVTVNDLTADKQILIDNLLGDGMKNSSLDSLNNNILNGCGRTEKAIITRTVKFTDKNLYNIFCNMFMEDWDFCRGKGGSSTFDSRINSENWERLTAEQRERVEWVSSECIGVYLNGNLTLVINPEGFNYARYVYIPTAETTQTKANDYITAQEKTTAEAPDFYIPASLDKQLNDSNLEEGDTFTALYVDGWMLSAQQETGKITNISVGKYAQYNNTLNIEFIPQGKRKAVKRNFHSGVVIYRGQLPNIPENLKYNTVSDKNGVVMQEVLFAGMNADKYIPIAIEYYKSIGFTPVINTIPA